MELFKTIIYGLKLFAGTFGHGPFKTTLEVIFGGWLITAFANWLQFVTITFSCFNGIGVLIGLLYLAKTEWK